MCSKSACKSTSSFSSAFLEPSTIHHIYSESNNMLSNVVDQCVIEVSRKILHNGDLPKLQVVQKDGNWFTLNNAQLDLCMMLEKEGKCSKVKVDVVPLKQVPGMIVGMMNIPETKSAPKMKVTNDTSAVECARQTNVTKTTGYERLSQSEAAEGPQHPESEAEASVNDTSDFGDTDSEYDWSDSEAVTSDYDSAAGTENGNSSSENESLL